MSNLEFVIWLYIAVVIFLIILFYPWSTKCGLPRFENPPPRPLHPPPAKPKYLVKKHITETSFNKMQDLFVGVQYYAEIGEYEISIAILDIIKADLMELKK